MPERAPLEAVVLDAGGTLIRLDYEWMSAEVTALGHPLDPETLRRGEVEGRRRFDRARRSPLAAWTGGAGEVPEDTRAYFGGMLDGVGVPAPVAERALRRFLERQRGAGLWTCPAESARGALDTLRADGFRLACISNSDGRAEQHLRDCGMLAGLEFVVDSHLEQVEKPDPRIFRIALERLGVTPARALYVGDLASVDREGAGEAGMHFVLLDPFGDYAPDGVSSVPGMAALPTWIRSRFTPVAGAAAGPHRTGPSGEHAGRDLP